MQTESMMWVAIQVYDQRETELPSVGLMKVKDAETGAERWIDSSSANST